MPTITPCLWFPTEGEDAARFYVSVFPNSRIRSVDRCGPGMHLPEGTAVSIQLELDGQPWTILNGGPEVTPDDFISFQIACADQEAVDAYWDRLTSDGGQESRCGWLKDRFGVSWQVVPRALGSYLGGPDPAGAQRATQAMLTMRKLDIETLRLAYEGL